MAIIPSCSELIEASRRERVQDQATNFISGWMNSVVFLGEFLGPFIGGYLIEYAKENIKVFMVVLARNIKVAFDIVRRMIFHWVPHILQPCVDWLPYYVD